MTIRKDNRSKDDFWDYRLKPCKTNCKDYTPYQNGTTISEGTVDWTWQYKKTKHKAVEDEFEEVEDAKPRIWRNI